MPSHLNRSLIEVSGPDAITLLDNLLTQSLAGLSEAGVKYGALLSPQGKVIADMFIWAHDGGAILDVDPSRAADLLKRLTMYKLRSDVHIGDVTEHDSVLASDAPFDGAVADPRLAALGWRAVETIHTAKADAIYEERRLALAIPDLARDAGPEEVFAGEALLEELNGVAFDKGCFVGQENVSRMKRRATTRKKFCPVMFDGPAPIYGTPVRAGAAELGTIRTGMNGRAMALLRLDRVLEAQANGETLTADGRSVRLDPPPWLILPPREGSAHGAPD